MVNLGILLGDKFETKKGCYVCTGIAFDSRGYRKGIIFKPYVSYDDDRTPGNFLSDEDIDNNYSDIKYIGNIN